MRKHHSHDVVEIDDCLIAAARAPSYTVRGREFAVAEDGTIEALEDPERWVASVQWHPEAMELPAEERLAPFQAFVEVCRGR